MREIGPNMDGTGAMEGFPSTSICSRKLPSTHCSSTWVGEHREPSPSAARTPRPPTETVWWLGHSRLTREGGAA